MNTDFSDRLRWNEMWGTHAKPDFTLERKAPRRRQDCSAQVSK